VFVAQSWTGEPYNAGLYLVEHEYLTNPVARSCVPAPTPSPHGTRPWSRPEPDPPPGREQRTPPPPLLLVAMPAPRPTGSPAIPRKGDPSCSSDTGATHDKARLTPDTQ
jgi:hypothetical protein